MIWWWIGIFIVDLFTAYTWAQCVKSVAEKKPIASALWGGAVYLSGAVTVISYNKDVWLLIPAILGSMVGTYISVKYKKNDS